MAALTNGEARAVEHVVWTGTPTVGDDPILPHLAENTAVFGDPQGAVTIERQSAADVVTDGTAATVVAAISLLEEELARCYGAQGVIHVPRAALAWLDHFTVVRREGQQLRTLAGNVVAAYSAGDRHGPTGAEPAAGQTWFYATGAVQVYSGPLTDHGVQPASFIGRQDNSTVYVVERPYLISWDCCHLAAQVQLAEVVT